MTADSSASTQSGISLFQLFVRFRHRVLLTWTLVVLEAALMLLFPLVLGIAIDGMLQQSWLGLYLLGGTGFLTVVVGASRRLYDTRAYAAICTTAAEEIVQRERGRNSDVSVISARTRMVTELVDFLETSFPEITDCLIGVVGTLVMIWFLQPVVFVGCLAATVVVGGIYAATGNLTYAFNKGLNDESERHVDVLARGEPADVSQHLKQMMRWKIRLSDLETGTFSASWLVMIAMLVFSVAATVQGGVATQGQVLSILMYVFGFCESVITLPFIYQQMVRLQEISHRLAES